MYTRFVQLNFREVSLNYRLTINENGWVTEIFSQFDQLPEAARCLILGNRPEVGPRHIEAFRKTIAPALLLLLAGRLVPPPYLAALKPVADEITRGYAQRTDLWLRDIVFPPQHADWDWLRHELLLPATTPGRRTAGRAGGSMYLLLADDAGDEPKKEALDYILQKGGPAIECLKAFEVLFTGAVREHFLYTFKSPQSQENRDYLLERLYDETHTSCTFSAISYLRDYADPVVDATLTDFYRTHRERLTKDEANELISALVVNRNEGATRLLWRTFTEMQPATQKRTILSLAYRGYPGEEIVDYLLLRFEDHDRAMVMKFLYYVHPRYYPPGDQLWEYMLRTIEEITLTGDPYDEEKGNQDYPTYIFKSFFAVRRVTHFNEKVLALLRDARPEAIITGIILLTNGKVLRDQQAFITDDQLHILWDHLFHANPFVRLRALTFWMHARKNWLPDQAGYLLLEAYKTLDYPYVPIRLAADLIQNWRAPLATRWFELAIPLLDQIPSPPHLSKAILTLLNNCPLPTARTVYLKYRSKDYDYNIRRLQGLLGTFRGRHGRFLHHADALHRLRRRYKRWQAFTGPVAEMHRRLRLGE